MFVKTVLLSAAGILASCAAVFAQDGEALYETKCGRCHVAYAPDEYAPAQWSGIVRSMKGHAALTPEQEQMIVAYLETASDDNQEASSAAGPILGGYLYTEYFQTPQRTSNFDIHYLAFYASGWVSDKIAYFGQFELEHGGTGGNNTFVEQAYLDYWFVPNLAVRIGAILTPYNRFDEFHDPITNLLITRPQVSRELGVSAWKDVGVDVHGYVNLGTNSSLGFNLYGINGLGSGSRMRGSRQYRDNNENKALGGRVNFVLFDVLELGGSAYQGKWDDDGTLNLRLLGSHMLLKTDVIDLYAEYSKASSENPAPLADGDMRGFFIQGSRLFASKYRATIRYGGLDYLDPGDQLGRSPTDTDLTELALGFSFYPVSKAALKLEYTFFMEGDRATSVGNNQLGIQAAVRF